jgi:arginine/serine-rich splicing factor 4/5/6
MKSLYCGNLGYDVRQSDIELLFGNYGRVERVDMRYGYALGYAFVHMEDERDAEEAIRALDQTEFGRQGRRLTVNWKKPDEEGLGRSEDGRRSVVEGLKPTKILFVVDFEPCDTTVSDLERHFEPYGKVLDVRIRRHFAFIYYGTQEEATKAFNATHMSKLLDRVITVAYSQGEKGNRRGGPSGPIRGGRNGRSGEDHGRDRSASAIYGRRAIRGSPDYGRARSPTNVRRSERCSPDYGRATSRIYSKRPEKHGSDYGRAASSVYASRPQRNSRDYGRDASPLLERDRSRSPVRRSRPSIMQNHSRISPARGNGYYMLKK